MQKTAYEMRISDWSSDVCSSDLAALAVAEADVEDDSAGGHPARGDRPRRPMADGVHHQFGRAFAGILAVRVEHGEALGGDGIAPQGVGLGHLHGGASESAQRQRSEEHTSELQSLMRISYAVFCLKKKMKQHPTPKTP